MNALRKSYFWSHFQNLSTVTSTENIILFSLPLILLLLISDDVMTSYTDVLKFFEEFGNNDFCIVKLSKIQIDVHQSLMNLLNLNYAN